MDKDEWSEQDILGGGYSVCNDTGWQAGTFGGTRVQGQCRAVGKDGIGKLGSMKQQSLMSCYKVGTFSSRPGRVIESFRQARPVFQKGCARLCCAGFGNLETCEEHAAVQAQGTSPQPGPNLAWPWELVFILLVMLRQWHLQ